MSLDLISFKIRLIATLLSNLYIPSKNFPQHRTKNSKKKTIQIEKSIAIKISIQSTDYIHFFPKKNP